MNKFYNYAFIAKNISWMENDELQKIDDLFPLLAKSHQAPFVYNESEKKILVKSNSIANLAEIFEKKLWASKRLPSKSLIGWSMYVILNKTEALKKYNRLFGVKFEVISQIDDCKVIWPSQKIEQWDKIDNIILSKVLKNKEVENEL